MVKLSDLQVALLLEEIACSMRVGTPILDGMQRLESRRLGRVARAARVISAGLARGESVADAFRATASDSRQQAAAVILAASTSADPGLIERVASQFRQRSYFARETRIAWFYPWLLLALGYLVAVLVMAPLIRRSQGSGIEWAGPVTATAIWLESNWWIPPMLAVVLLLAFLTWLFSRNRFSRPARIGLFCSSLADQFAHDIPEGVAIASAAEISGDERLMSIRQPSLNCPELAPILSTRVADAETVSGISRKQTLIANLRYTASLNMERARRRNYLWSRLIPRCAVVIVGAGLTLSYALWVIAPVYLQVANG